MKPIHWETLYRNNAPKLKGICRRYVGNDAIAEDLVHETFITAIEKANTLRNSRAIEGWIRKIAINKALLYLRQQKHTVPLDEAYQMPVNETDMKHSCNKIKASIEQASFTASELLTVIDRLPIHHRTVFNLYVMEGYSHKQIAQMLSISPGTSKSHLSRARKKAQKLLFTKAQEKHAVVQRRNFAWLLLLLWPGRPVDHIFRHGLKGFEMATPTPTFIQNAPPLNTLNRTAKLMGKSVIYGLTATLIAGTIWLISEKYYSRALPNNPKPTIISTLPDTIQSIETDTLTTKTTEPVSEEQVHSETAKPEQTPKAKPIIIKKTIVIRDTVRIEKTLE